VSQFAIQHIEAGYGRVTILRDVSISLDPAEIVALIGPNGAGKSTLLRAATGIVKPSKGSVTLGARDLTGASIEAIARAGIAHVPEGRRLFPGLTVRDNLLLGGWRNRERNGWRDRERGLEPVLALFPKLGQRLTQVAGSMSGGEQQMCAIGRALVGRPEFLLIDELSLGLAPLVVDEIMARLADVAAAGTGILLVEQDAGAALEVAGRAYVLENGRVTLHRPAGELLADPRVREAYLGVA
jgi:branched-chain amino acid transport system ATP-binding protein